MNTIDLRLRRAFAWHKKRVGRIVVLRFLLCVLALLVPLFVRHWAAWLVFALFLVMYGLPTLVLAIVVPRANRRFYERLRDNPESLAWTHLDSEPAQRDLHQLELRLRDGNFCSLFTPSDVAEAAVEAALAMSPSLVVTRSKEEHAAKLAAFEHEGKLVELEERLEKRDSPLSREIRPELLELLTRWRDARKDAPATAVSEVEGHVRELFILLNAARDYEAIDSRHREELGALSDVFKKPGVSYLDEATPHMNALRAAVEQLCL